MKIDVIEGQDFNWDGTKLTYEGRLRWDNDGTGPSHGDPYHQSDTSLHHFGRPLNADIERYGVLPEQVAREIAPVVLGCQGYATYKGKRVSLVLGDLGPKNREGEGSTALLEALGVEASNEGGIDTASIFWEFYPGQPAVVDGVTYPLQAL